MGHADATEKDERGKALMTKAREILENAAITLIPVVEQLDLLAVDDTLDTELCIAAAGITGALTAVGLLMSTVAELL